MTYVHKGFARMQERNPYQHPIFTVYLSHYYDRTSCYYKTLLVKIILQELLLQ